MLALEGDLTGQVVFKGYTGGQIILDAIPITPLEEGGALDPYVVPQPGAFGFPALPKGLLVLQATLDVDADGPTPADRIIVFDRYGLDLGDPDTPRELIIDLDRETISDAGGGSLEGDALDVPAPLGPPRPDTPAEAPSPPDATPQPPGGGSPRTPPSGGNQVFTQPAPADVARRSTGALCADCDVVLITVCSLRQDHVGVYGELRPSPTPTIDSLADGGFSFSNAYAASNFTLASLTAVLTGRFGSSTGVTHWDKGLTADVPTLPEVLGLYGYKTGAFTMDAYSGFRPDYGLDRGFQHMAISSAPRSTPDGRRRAGGTETVSTQGDGASAMPAAAWMAAHTGSEPLFVMLHSRTAHFPFVVSDTGAADDPTGVHQALWDAGHDQRQDTVLPGDAGGTSTEGAVAPTGQDPLKVLVDRVGEPAVTEIRRHYRAAVARMDVDVKRLVETQERRGRMDKTIWLVVADHGESLNDHDELLHGAAFYDTVINVPLVLKVPGLRPSGSGMLDGLVSHVDILPTLVELVGAIVPADADGASMVPLLTGKADGIRETALSEGGVTKPRGNHLPGAIIAPPWALLRHEGGCDPDDPHSPRPPPGEPASCLFNLDQDPDQTDVVTTLHPDVEKELLARWASFRAAHGGAAVQLDLDPAFVAELRRTGYDFRLDGQ